MNGILNIYKEAGYTSFDVVAKLRGILKQKKIGHTGTLDPAAQGVLPVCIGRATKLCELLTDGTKAYEAVLLLGTETDTLDLEGNVLKQTLVTCSEEEVRECLASFVGEGEQIPPMYSALKVKGKRLYELAREGIEVERKSRKVTFFEIKLLQINLPRVRFWVKCSKGTYIRSLCDDIGRKLGCGGCMESLKRTASGSFTLETALTLSKVEELVREGKIEEALIPMDAYFKDYRKVSSLKEADKAVHNGNALFLKMSDAAGKGLAEGEKVRVYDSQGKFIGIYCYESKKESLKAFKILME